MMSSAQTAQKNRLLFLKPIKVCFVNCTLSFNMILLTTTYLKSLMKSQRLINSK